MNEFTFEQGGFDTNEARRIAAPASLFTDGPQPPFVLFDRRGRRADLVIARTVYISPSDEAALDAFLRGGLVRIAESRRIEQTARAWALHHVLINEVDLALRVLPDLNAIPRLTPIVELAAAQVVQDPGAYLAEVAHTVQSPATHAVATALYALTLAASEGLDDRVSLVRIGMAALLADVSKFRMPRLVARGADLTDGERELLRTHAQHGADMLGLAGVRDKTLLDAVRLHHERWDGRGYPTGMRGAAIPLEARILRIADGYAALTVDRPDAPGLRGYEALMEMAQSEGEFEPRLLRSYVRALGRALSVNARWSTPDDREIETEESNLTQMRDVA